MDIPCGDCGREKDSNMVSHKLRDYPYVLQYLHEI